MDGFRKVVAMQIIKERYGPQVRQEVLSDVIQSSLVDALAQEKLNPVGMPSIEDTQFEQGKPLIYTAVFEVYPEVALKPFDTIKVEKLVAAVTDADIEKTLQVIRGQYKNWTPVGVLRKVTKLILILLVQLMTLNFRVGRQKILS